MKDSPVTGAILFRSNYSRYNRNQPKGMIMKSKLAFAALNSLVAVGAFTAGMEVMRKMILRKMDDVEPLLHTLIVNAYVNAHDEDLTRDELRAYLQENVDFINIVSR